MFGMKDVILNESHSLKRSICSSPTLVHSGTDWERVDALTDTEIDTSDIPPLANEFFKRARSIHRHQVHVASEYAKRAEAHCDECTSARRASQE